MGDGYQLSTGVYSDAEEIFEFLRVLNMGNCKNSDIFGNI